MNGKVPCELPSFKLPHNPCTALCHFFCCGFEPTLPHPEDGYTPAFPQFCCHGIWLLRCTRASFMPNVSRVFSPHYRRKCPCDECLDLLVELFSDEWKFDYDMGAVAIFTFIILCGVELLVFSADQCFYGFIDLRPQHVNVLHNSSEGRTRCSPAYQSKLSWALLAKYTISHPRVWF